MPSGTPAAIPMTAAAVACQATVAASWRWVKPIVLSTARSRLRRRTEANRVRPSAATAAAARLKPAGPAWRPWCGSWRSGPGAAPGARSGRRRGTGCWRARPRAPGWPRRRRAATTRGRRRRSPRRAAGRRPGPAARAAGRRGPRSWPGGHRAGAHRGVQPLREPDGRQGGRAHDGQAGAVGIEAFDVSRSCVHRVAQALMQLRQGGRAEDDLARPVTGCPDRRGGATAARGRPNSTGTACPSRSAVTNETKVQAATSGSPRRLRPTCCCGIAPYPLRSRTGRRSSSTRTAGDARPAWPGCCRRSAWPPP